MKRTVISILVLSLAALPLFAESAKATKARCLSLEHVRGAWVMKVECVEGAGSILMADNGRYRGEGVFSTWSQERLRTMYDSLIPKDETRIELLQLG